MNKNKRKKYSKLDNILEIPREVISTDSKVTILGFDEMLIENYKNILEYQDVFVRINTFEGIIDINGINLKLEEMTNDDIKITGKIDSIELEPLTD